MPWITSNNFLTQSQMENNADIVISHLRSNNFNSKTIAGILSNLQHESTINPRTGGDWRFTAMVYASGLQNKN